MATTSLRLSIDVEQKLYEMSAAGPKKIINAADEGGADVTQLTGRELTERLQFNKLLISENKRMENGEAREFRDYVKGLGK